MKRVFVFLTLSTTVAAFATHAQTTTGESVSVSNLEAPARTFFPHNWVRGYTDFSVAPSHNEPDLGRCMFPQPANAGGTASTCTAYARYLYSGYIEFQPMGRTLARHFFLFFEPKFSFGRNIPQLTYTASMAPIAYDRSIGIGFQLPRNFELRATQHQVDWLGRYGRSLGTADLHTNGSYGLYATFGVRWSFGGYGRQGAPTAY
ncbi:MAG: hypothetical protein AUI12_10960 [Acidobacteria bacterium 13_2_20CM_2_57_6]|nr:MAG: hypothetical protein AUH16_07345 [Acidobacteria bacterium 13_2_20CM_57_7]OLB85586.1 MAG: hypothetical protein AUI12_10960 [Acidobacteria bacterium 13_2_20CM_2_57_6]PYT34572.1 MAG: hypothetical protein DMG58_04520 [Acidobacteriota bacterium]PYT41418.1 MAG: hypothetical protein DMG45_13305 [Acidobacteriota bacterium]